jgi:hypothetical protein
VFFCWKVCLRVFPIGQDYRAIIRESDMSQKSCGLALKHLDFAALNWAHTRRGSQPA